MRKALLGILLPLGLCWASGCSPLVRNTIVTGARLAERDDVRRLDPNDPNHSPYLVKVTQRDGGQLHYHVQVRGSNLHMGNKPSRVKYRKSKLISDHRVIVEGYLPKSRRRYPVVLDTGSTRYISVNDIHILENELAIYPFVRKGGEYNGSGICYLPKLQIGDVAFIDMLCEYQEKHTEIHLLGLPVAAEKEILLGLPVLRKFKYVAFDGVRGEVEFSARKGFETQHGSSWSQYRLAIKPGSDGDPRLYVDIPIAGTQMHLEFDSGAANALNIAEQTWKSLQKRVGRKRRTNTTLWFPFLGGYLTARSYAVAELQIGDRLVEDAVLSVLPDESPLLAKFLEEGEALLGMQSFCNTVMVLDFEHNLMWVRNDGAY